MSKKKNKKFKKIKPKLKPAIATNTGTFTSSDPVFPEKAVETPPANEKIIESENAYKNPEYDHVKKDIKKILLIITILIVLFAGIYVLGEKTNSLKAIGDWIYRVANINAG